MSKSCVVNVGTDGGCVYFMVSGYASFVEAAEISHYLDRLPSSQVAKKYMFNLAECEKMDSTFMGLIARLSCGSNHQKNVHVVDCRGSALKCLEDLGLNLMVQLCDDWNIGQLTLAPIRASGLQRREKEEVIRKSHETLSSLNEKNRQNFADVMESFKPDSN